MAIADIANLESNLSVRNKLNALIGQANTGTFPEAAIGGQADYLDVAADGTVTLVGNATGWDDLLVPFTESVKGSLPKPDWDATNYAFAFPQNDATEYVSFNFQMPHRWKEGTTVYPHVHFLQDQNQAPTFKLDWRWFNLGASVPSFTTGYTMGTLLGNQTWSSGLLSRIVHGSGGLDGTGKTISSILQIKLYRSDNLYTGDCLAVSFDLHYQIDSFGSASEYTK